MNQHFDPASANRTPEWRPAQIVARRDLTPTIRELSIRLEMPTACPVGSHLKIAVPTGVSDDFRSYSIVQVAGDVIRIAVKRLADSRGGSAFMWTLDIGDAVQVTPPQCDFPLNEQAPHFLLLAGGVGVTPMIAMAERLAHRGAAVKMLYAARDASEFAYQAELAALLGERLCLHDASAGQIIDLRGEIDALPADAELYMCGPLGMMDAVKAIWAEQGRPRSALRYETFGSSGKFAVAPFVVNVPRLGIRVEVPENRTMLDALEEAGVAVLSECRRGECGLCAVEIVDLEGDIDHRDVFFSAQQHAESQRMCACVSRVAGGQVTINPAFRGDDAFVFP
ncbi:MAG: PDR/VanB family oxidoreductase [Brevundimonas sp.]